VTHSHGSVFVCWWHLSIGVKTRSQERLCKQECAGVNVVRWLWAVAKCPAAGCQGWTTGRYRPAAGWAKTTGVYAVFQNSWIH